MNEMYEMYKMDKMGIKNKVHFTLFYFRGLKLRDFPPTCILYKCRFKEMQSLNRTNFKFSRIKFLSENESQAEENIANLMKVMFF